MRLFFLPPRTPEMNPVELIWREIRKRGFKNKVFSSISAVIEKLYEISNGLTKDDVQSLSFWGWIKKSVGITQV
jgi:transposase